MTRADVIEHLTDVMRLHGFVGSNSALPATSEDVTGLLIQLQQKGDELIERLEPAEPVRKAPDAHLGAVEHGRDGQAVIDGYGHEV